MDLPQIYDGIPADVDYRRTDTGESMRIAGLDAGWLRRILQAQGIERDRDVLIATLDTQGSLLVQEKGSEGRLMTLPVMKSGQVRW